MSGLVARLLLFYIISSNLTLSLSYNCKWHVVGKARSLIANACLRLSVYQCDCSTAGGCPGKYYKVDRMHTQWQCSATITWCEWQSWNHHIQTDYSSTGCSKVSVRKRSCCIVDNGGENPVRSLNSRLWSCPSTIFGDSQKIVEVAPCPASSNVSFVLISVIVCLFTVCVMVIITRVFFYKRISNFFQRRSRGRNTPRRRYQNHNAPSPINTYCQSVASLPNYDEAIRQMSKLPSYEEAMGNNGNVSGNSENIENTTGNISGTPDAIGALQNAENSERNAESAENFVGNMESTDHATDNTPSSAILCPNSNNQDMNNNPPSYRESDVQNETLNQTTFLKESAC